MLSDILQQWDEMTITWSGSSKKGILRAVKPRAKSLQGNVSFGCAKSSEAPFWSWLQVEIDGDETD